METFTLPTIPEDFITGQPFVGAIHPSLKQLNDYITRKFKRDFVGVDIVSLNEYVATTKQPWSSGAYYLFGQLLTSFDAPLTNELLQEAIRTDARRKIDYGSPCNSMEAASINHNIRVFHNLLYLLQRYYQHPYDLMEFYKPDGEYMTKFIEESCS
jgi:hypothetical protein